MEASFNSSPFKPACDDNAFLSSFIFATPLFISADTATIAPPIAATATAATFPFFPIPLKASENLLTIVLGSPIISVIPPIAPCAASSFEPPLVSILFNLSAPFTSISIVPSISSKASPAFSAAFSNCLVLLVTSLISFSVWSKFNFSNTLKSLLTSFTRFITSVNVFITLVSFTVKR